MTNAPEWEDKYHPPRITHAGNAPKGWDDEHRYAPYIRADLVPDPAAIHAKAIAQAVEWHEVKAGSLANIYGEDEELVDIHLACAAAIRALSPDPDLVVVIDKDVQTFAERLSKHLLGEKGS